MCVCVCVCVWVGGWVGVNYVNYQFVYYVTCIFGNCSLSFEIYNNMCYCVLWCG